MVAAFINLIIWLLVVGILYWLVVYVVDNFIPEPPARIVKVAALVILALFIVILLLDMLGGGVGGLDLPKIAS